MSNIQLSENNSFPKTEYWPTSWIRLCSTVVSHRLLLLTPFLILFFFEATDALSASRWLFLACCLRWRQSSRELRCSRERRQTIGIDRCRLVFTIRRCSAQALRAAVWERGARRLDFCVCSGVVFACESGSRLCYLIFASLPDNSSQRLLLCCLICVISSPTFILANQKQDLLFL